MGTLYKTALVLHITGFCVMVGATLAQFAGLRFFWGRYSGPGETNRPVLAGVLSPGRLVGAGFMLLLLSGGTMLYITDWVYTEQPWFRVKITIIAAMVFLNIRLQSRQEKKLLTLVGAPESSSLLLRARRRLDLRLSVELAAFAVIFVLAIFKFNYASDGSTTLAASPNAQSAGAKTYQANCRACHGSRGDAGIARAANLRVSKLAPLEIRKIIRRGRNGMPSFANRFESGELTSLVNYIIQLREKKNESSGNNRTGEVR